MAKMADLEYKIHEITDRIRELRSILGITEDEMAEAPEYDDEDSFSTKTRLPRFVMKDAILKDFITDPHQHILYEYDFIDPKTFYIEFQKVAQTEKPDEFPRCTFQKGTLSGSQV